MLNKNEMKMNGEKKVMYRRILWKKNDVKRRRMIKLKEQGKKKENDMKIDRVHCKKKVS